MQLTSIDPNVHSDVLLAFYMSSCCLYSKDQLLPFIIKCLILLSYCGPDADMVKVVQVEMLF